MHEVGHCFYCEHNDGMIKQVYNEHRASPMCTWYVEPDYLIGENQDERPEYLCSSSTDETSKHIEQLSTCTVTQIENHEAIYL
jgi:hypothetical protein